MVKEFLSKKGLAFEGRDVSKNNSYAKELVNSTGQMGVPVTVVDGQTVIGFDRGRLEQLVAQTQAKRPPSFGASIADVGKITPREGVAVTPGAYVGKVKQGSVAERAGLVAGDIITELNMKPIVNTGYLLRLFSAMNKGSRFSLVFLRSNKAMNGEGKF
jgi:glutaredoxin 3